MAPPKEEALPSIEPLFLSKALADHVKLRVGQMNKTEHDGTLRDIGRYEVNIEEQGRLVTILKQDIAFLSSPHPLLAASSPAPADAAAPAAGPGRPNIQQEFLDRAIREHHLLTLFLLNGQRIRAVVEAYDNFTLLLREGERQHLYYKHAITTINR